MIQTPLCKEKGQNHATLLLRFWVQVQGVPINERLISEYNKQPTMEQFRFIKKYYPQCLDRQSLEFIKP